MLTVGAAVLSWTYLMLPYARDPGLPLLAKVVALAYPLGDLVLLVVTARPAVGPGQRPAAFGIADRTGLACQAELDLPGRLEPEVETVLYRVVQESLTNVAKHARASNVSVHLRDQGDAVALDVRDDGVGFEATRASGLLRAGHFGLAGMRERVSLVGGRWEVQAVPGGGTRIAVHLPRQVTPVG